ncbi:type II secretion system F family protein [Pontibacterium granulatum]|uniref:type II secretion system F family protein n=1 Tax=Pontibacterium granulatum TaxID=2036029 RepID=UPI00249A32F7|nr:type II secretion system F family protein [Pontibacterium granulatum]MDI3323795.1 type II secretion system F family protein [Pontibacterium granulatum]
MEIELGPVVFFSMVGIAVFLLSFGITVPVFGESRATRKRLQKRLRKIQNESDKPPISNLLREKYLKQLGSLERYLEELPGMEKLARIIEQSGHTILAYRVVLASLLLAALAGVVVFIVTKYWWAGVIAASAGFVAPYLKIYSDRRRRMERFDEQLPEAIDIIKRALQAGHPFSESLHIVSESLDAPIGKEFAITFADLNYGNDLRRAMLGLLERVPSITLMAFITSVLVQKETGGNLAEVLDKISRVIRGRFKFQRKVKTLSAEGRLSAWILTLVPFGLFVMIYFTTPDYLPILAESSTGRQLIIVACVMMILGIIWIRRLLKIEV